MHLARPRWSANNRLHQGSTGQVSNPNTPYGLPCLSTWVQRQGGRCSYVPTLPDRARRPCRTYALQRQGPAGNNPRDAHAPATDDAAVPDIWAPVPPTPALGRKRKVAVLIAAAMLEITLTGTLVWSPLLSAVALAVMQPTKAEIQQQQDEAVKQATAAAELQAYRHLPVTPVEGAAWLNRLNQEMWSTFWQPFLLANNLSSWQDTVSAAAPRGWEVEIADVSIGTLAPQMSGFQAFADPNTGAVTAVDADIAFNSSSVMLVVVGRGPLGAFTAKVSAVQLEGHIRIIPLLQHRMLLVAFKQSPSVRVSLSLSAPLFKTALSPGDLGQLNFIQGLIGHAIKDQLVEPRRMAISLDSDIRVEQAVSTHLHIKVDSITGLPRSLLVTEPSAGRAGVPQVALVLVDTTTQVRRATRAVSPTPLRRAAQLQQQLSLELRRKQGLFRLEAREVTTGPGGRVSASRGQLLGSCLLWVAAARDGTTLFWSHDRSGAPVATRWSPASNRPWQVTLPLNPEVPGAQGLEVNLGVAVEPWVYKAGLSQGVPGAHRTPGPRVVILQVVEGRGLSIPGGQSWPQYGPTTHIQVAYGQDTYTTSTQYGTSSPIFNEVFALQETPGIITNRIKLEVWQEDAAEAASSTPHMDMGRIADSRQPSRSSSSSSRATGDSTQSSSSSYSSSHPRRLLVPSSRRAGYKAVSKLRYSSNLKTNSSSSSSSAKGGSEGNTSSTGGGSSHVASYQLTDVEPESEAADPESHMLVDLELQDDEGDRQRELGASSSSSSSSSSGGGSNDGSESLGSVSIELDQLTEGLVQDRWFELSGADGGHIRLRLAVVPGMLPGGDSRWQQPAQADVGDDVTRMLAFFHKQLQSSSRDSVQVEVLSARLYLPLSSMDSSDLDQPSYVLSYSGRSTVSTPPYSRPARSRPSSRTSGSSSSSAGGAASGSVSSSLSRPSGGASRSGGRSVQTSGGTTDSVTGSIFEDVVPGNVSQQVVQGTCLARAIFPLQPQTSHLTATPPGGPSSSLAAAQAAAAGGAEAAVAAAAAGQDGQVPSLKVLLFDPEDFSHASAAAAAAAITAAAASIHAPAALPGKDGAGGDTQGVSSSSAATSGSGPVAHPILLSSRSSGSSSSGELTDLGGVEVDVQQLLSRARQDKDGADTAPGAGGDVGVLDSSSAPAASWEGWVKLDKDGGHLLLRLTELPAAEPTEIVPPIASSSAAAAPASQLGATAAAAAGLGGTAGGSADSLSSAEEELEGLQDKLTAVVKLSVASAQDQVANAVHQLAGVTSAATQWIDSSSSWISSSAPSWLTPWRTDSSSNPQQPSPEHQHQHQKQQQKQQQQHDRTQVPAAPATQQAATKAASQQSGHAGSTEQQQQQQQLSSKPAAEVGEASDSSQPHEQQQHDATSRFGVDLRFISRALGLGGSGSTKPNTQQQQKKHKQQHDPTATRSKQQAPQQQQHLQEGHQQQQQQPQPGLQEQTGVLLSQKGMSQHPLQSHALQPDDAAAPGQQQQAADPGVSHLKGVGAARGLGASPAAGSNGKGPRNSSTTSSSHSSNGSRKSVNTSAEAPVLAKGEQQQQRSHSHDATAAASNAGKVSDTGSPASGSIQGQQQQQPHSPAKGVVGSAAAGVAAATAAVAGSELGPEPAVQRPDVWSYDGYGDEGQEDVGRGAEWEGAQEEQEEEEEF